MGFWATYLTWTGMFGALVFFTLALINFLQGGYFFPFMRVKMSNGKKILVRVKGLTQDYFRVGKFSEGNLIFKDNKKSVRQLTFPKEAIFRGAGVYYCIVDDDKNAIVKLDFSTVSGFDAEKWNNLLERALTKPQLMDTQARIILALLVVIVIAILILALMIKSNGDKITALKLVSDSAITAGQAITTGGA